MATSPVAIRGAVFTLAAAAVAQVVPLLSTDRPREAVLDVAPEVVGIGVLGSSALAVDWYEELREEARPRTRHLTVVPEWGRAEKYGNAVAWATAPLLADVVDLAEARRRLADVTEAEVFRGFTDTTEANVRTDPAARGWRREARPGACKFCLMLADRGAVYRKEAAANFAAHGPGPNGGGLCRCTVVPVFEGGYEGPEASVIQYAASKRYRTQAERDANNARVRAYLAEHYGDN